MTINFWPDGHGEIPSIAAPNAPLPHLEIGVAQFGSVWEVGYYDATGTQNPGRADCQDVESGTPPTTPMTSVETQRAVELTCEIPSTSEIWTTLPGVTPATVEVFADGALVAVAELTVESSSLRYDPAYCDTAPAPTS